MKLPKLSPENQINGILSQTVMPVLLYVNRKHLRPEGWKHSLLINWLNCFADETNGSGSY